MTLAPHEIAAIWAVLIAAGTIKGTIGFGLPLVAVSVLTQLLPLDWALALMVLPIVFSNAFIGFHRGLFLIVGFSRAGVLIGDRLWWSLAACVPVAVGLWAGTRLRDRIDAEHFRRLVLLALLLLGANLIRRGLS